MKYDHDDVVTTRDGRRHRVLWGTKTDAAGNHVRLQVKSLDDKHKKGYQIDCDKITGHEPRKGKVYD